VLVVDTDVISYLFKEDTRADLYKPHLQGHLLLISPMTRAVSYLNVLTKHLPRKEFPNAK
jgi:hypothetical protein